MKEKKSFPLQPNCASILFKVPLIEMAVSFLKQHFMK